MAATFDHRPMGHPTPRDGLGRAWLIVLVLAAFAGRAAFVALPVNSDTAMFVYAGKLVAEGGRPGVDLLDNKLPSVGLLMSVPYRCFGAHWSAYAGLGLLLSLAACAFLYRVARDLWGRDAAIATGVAAAVFLNFPMAVYGQLQLETIQICFASIAAPCVLRALRSADWRDTLTAGLCGGMAIWAKPTGGAVLLAAAVTITFLGAASIRKRLLCCGTLVLGTAIAAVTCAVAIVATGMAAAIPETLRQLRDYSAQSSFDAIDAAKPAFVLTVLGFPLLILGVIFRRDRRSTTADHRDVVFVTLWLAAELAGVISQRRMYAYHFLVLGPPSALAVGLLVRRARATPLTMAFGPFVAATLAIVVNAFGNAAGPSRDDRVIAYVAGHVAGKDSIWADDYPRLLVETNRQPGSAVPLIFLMANGDGAPDFFGHRLLADWAKRRPTYIAFAAEPERVAELYRYHMADVVASPARAEAIGRQIAAVHRFLQANYHAEADISGVRIWRLNEKAPTDSVAAADPDGR